MAFPFDFLVVDERSAPLLAVETKALRGTDVAWAMELRRAILSRSADLRCGLLVATPNRLYLWTGSEAGEVPPRAIEAQSAFAPYFQRVGIGQVGTVDPAVFADVVQWWLRDLASGVDRGSNGPELQSILEVVKGRRVVAETAA